MNSYTEVCKKYKIEPISNFVGENKTVFLRVDFNVPVDGNNSIVDDFRIKSSIQTIEFLLEQDANIIIISHFGDPKNISDKTNLSFSKIVDQISKILNCEIKLIQSEDLNEISNEVNSFRSTRKIGDRKLLMLDNIRFFPEEKSNSKYFAAQILEKLKKLAECVGTPVQIISDWGSDIKKGINLYKQENPGVILTYDITHKMANLLKKELLPDENFKNFLRQCSLTYSLSSADKIIFSYPS